MLQKPAGKAWRRSSAQPTGRRRAASKAKRQQKPPEDARKKEKRIPTHSIHYAQLFVLLKKLIRRAISLWYIKTVLLFFTPFCDDSSRAATRRYPTLPVKQIKNFLKK
jgi:hypothetical protein